MRSDVDFYDTQVNAAIVKKNLVQDKSNCGYIAVHVNEARLAADGDDGVI